MDRGEEGEEGKLLLPVLFTWPSALVKRGWHRSIDGEVEDNGLHDDTAGEVHLLNL